MNEILYYIIYLFILICGILGSIKGTFKRRTISFSLERIIYYFSIFSGIMLIAIKIDIILERINKIVAINFKLEGIYNDICKIALLIGLFFLIQVIIYQILKIILMPIAHILNKNNTVLLAIISFVLGIGKGLIFISILFIGLITYNNTIGNTKKVELFENSKIYTKLNDVLEENTSSLTEDIVEEFLPTSNIIIYYNGVILEEGVKSTPEIDQMAISLTKDARTSLEKARILYSWVGSNMKYDYDRAEKALNNEKVENSGAISAFENKSGICFDYACLYVAMARAINLKVRLLTGSGFDGNQYGPHAWNEVYIESLSKWIPVDTTFYMAGDYFNNEDFYEDHIIDSIAGEW